MEERTHLRDFGLLFLRVVVGGGLAYHGYLKISGDMEGFAGFVGETGFPMPEVAAWAAALAEAVGGLFIFLGIVTRLAALPAAFTMVVALTMVHWGDPFEKIELPLLYLAALLAIALAGGGNYTLDHALFKKPKA